MPKKVSVTQESNSGRNQRFRDNYTKTEMTRPEFVRQIEKGNYDNYHIREINGVKSKRIPRQLAAGFPYPP